MDFSALKKALDELIGDNMPGGDCIVYKEHKEIFRYYRGMKDIESETKTDGSELYIAYSMTKMLTCTCALQLLEQGKYNLDDEVSKYLPEFNVMKLSNEEIDAEKAKAITEGKSFGEDSKAAAYEYAQNPITIRHLFTMTAGLDYNLLSEGIKEAIEKGETSTRGIVKGIAKTPLGFEPGTRFRYSLCHDVLGALIEVLSGMKLSEYMKKNLFDPLEMKNTFFGVPKDEERLLKMASRYTSYASGEMKKFPLVCNYNLSDEYESGGAGTVSCPEDYIVFLDALANGGVGKNGSRILKEETVKLMQTNQLKGEALEDFQQLRCGYGYGLGVRTHLDPKTSGSLSPVGEFGWDGAAGSFSMVDTENKVSLAFFWHMHNWNISLQAALRNGLYKGLYNDK